VISPDLSHRGMTYRYVSQWILCAWLYALYINEILAVELASQCVAQWQCK